MPFFVPEDAFRKAVADTLAQAGGAAGLAAERQAVADDCHKDAYEIIRSELLGAGYSADKIDGWPAGQVYERNIGLALYFVRTGLGRDQPMESTQKELDLWLARLKNAAVSPPFPASGGVGHGSLSETGLTFGADNWQV